MAEIPSAVDQKVLVRGMSEMIWRTIESAPKDGTALLLFSSSYEEAQSGRWAWAWQLPEGLNFKDRSLDTVEGYWVEKPYIDYDRDRYPYRPIHDVTHWMPLPDPPSTPTRIGE